MKRLLLSCLLLCSACATPQVQTYSAPPTTVVQPPKLAVDMKHQVLVTTDDTKLPVRRWVPKDKPKAIIVAIHGFNDYSRAFDLPGAYLKRRGIEVYAYDQRGFGQAPSPGIWAGEQNFVRDVADMVRAVKKQNPHVPVYVLGESMGGAIAIEALVQPDFPHVDGVILSAPAIWGGDTMNAFMRASLWTAVHIWPNKVLTGEDLHVLASDNIEMLRALGGDPLVIKATRLDAVYGLVKLMDKAYNDIGKVKVPMLVLYGAHDELIPPEPMIKGLRKVTADKKVAYYPLGYHMLLRDIHGEVPVKDIIAWIGDKKRPLPSGDDVAAQKFFK